MVKRILNRRLGVIVLAAGKGTRMESSLAKVLHPVAGKPMLERVLESAFKLQPIKIAVVIGYQEQSVRDAFSTWKGIDWVRQKEMKGTGDAVRTTADIFQEFEGPILVLYGDIPGIKEETLRRLAMVHSSSQNAITLLTAELEDPTGYGRILTNHDGTVAKIVEEKDATPVEKEIHEINTGIGMWESRFLFASLSLLRPSNRQKEYYLTDLVEMAARAAKPIGRMRVKDPSETLGINSREDLAEVSRIVFEEKALLLLKSGVTLEDPASASIEPEAEIGKDTSIESLVDIRGKTRIASRVKIGAGSKLEKCDVGNNVVVGRNVCIRSAKIGSNTTIASNTTVGQ